MPSAYAATIRARAEFTRETLTRLRDRSNALRASLVEATAALKAAQAVVDAMENECKEVDNQCSRLEHVLDTAPRAFDPQIMQRLPTEMLHTIFSFVVSRPDPDWPTPIVVDTTRCSAPFLLASVCKRWRAVALSSSSLWTYIAVPALLSTRETECDFHLARVKLLLERSNVQPLYVVVDWIESSNWPDEPNLARILAAIARHMSRVRYLFLEMPHGITLKQMNFLRNPAPLLERLQVYSADEDMLPFPAESDSIATFLPQSPLLRELSSGTIFVLPRQPFLRLACADLMLKNHDYPASAIWAALQMMPALEDLRLTFLTTAGRSEMEGTVDPPGAPLTLSALRSLDLHGRSLIVPSWSSALKLPALDALTFHGHCLLDRQFREFCLAVCSNITRLTVKNADPCHCEAMDPLPLPTMFPKLRQLCVHEAIPPSLLSYLGDSALWPALEKFEVNGCWLRGTTADMLLRLARNRCLERKPGLPPLAISLHDCSVSAWLVPQAELLIGDRLNLNVVDDLTGEDMPSPDGESEVESD